jgi:large subunit ribosomal protein L30
MLKITLTRGLVAKTETQKKVVRALGLRKFGSSVEHADSPTIRGMINKISHLVSVEGGVVTKAKKVKKEAPKAAKAPAKAKAQKPEAKATSKKSSSKAGA